MPRRMQLPQECTLRLLDAASELAAVVEFWSRYFSTKTCRSVVLVSHLHAMITKGLWDVWCVIGPAGHIVGTLVRRRIKGLHIGPARWADAGAIDYFCVHPAWRKRGIGRALLNNIHNVTPAPIPPHLIFWEGMRLAQPPLAAGCFLARRCTETTGPQGTRVHGPACKTAWDNCVKGIDVWTEEPGPEIEFWSGGAGPGSGSGSAPEPVPIWNTMHRSIGGQIGIVLGGSAAQINALATTASPWGVLLVPRTIPFTQDLGPEWKFDSVFQWIGYNLSVGFVSGSMPRIGF